MSDSDDPECEADEFPVQQSAMHGNGSTRVNPRSQGGRDLSGAADQETQRVAAIEGVNSDVAKFLKGGVRHPMVWREGEERYEQCGVPPEWKAWGLVAGNEDGYLKLRDTWLTWMSCTSKILQTVDNRHLNRHVDYMHSGPTVNFVDLEDSPQIGRRLQALAHFVECINNFGEFPVDCVIPTPETELLFGQGKACKTVRGMRMKNPKPLLSRDMSINSNARAGEKWLKSFRRGEIPVPENLFVYAFCICESV
jgi:hypothetical protein